MLVDLRENLTKFLNNTIHVAKNPESPVFMAQLALFEQNCAKTLKENFKYMAAEPTVWNAIKDLFNDACKFCGLGPKATLDASSVIKSRDIKDQMKAVKSAGIEIKEAAEIAVDLDRPGMSG